MHQQLIASKNIMGKEEIACNKQFLLFPQSFLLNQKSVSPFVNIFNIISLFHPELQEPKNGLSISNKCCQSRQTNSFSFSPNSELQQIKNICRSNRYSSNQIDIADQIDIAQTLILTECS